MRISSMVEVHFKSSRKESLFGKGASQPLEKRSLPHAMEQNKLQMHQNLNTKNWNPKILQEI